MFTKIFLNSLIDFLYLTLNKKPVTKRKIKKILLLFSYIWLEKLRETKIKNEKKVH